MQVVEEQRLHPPENCLNHPFVCYPITTPSFFEKLKLSFSMYSIYDLDGIQAASKIF